MKSHPWHDHYARRAREEGFPARSVYKLEEIQKRFRILKQGSRALDLGCAPGSWLLFASKTVGKTGMVFGVDVTPLSIQLPDNTRFIKHNVLSPDRSPLEAVGTGFDVVLSDMAPSTTGNKLVDAQKSLELSEAALSLSESLLKTGGSFVCKVFQGPDFKRYSDRVKRRFDRVVHLRLKTTRKSSREVYTVALGKKVTQEDLCPDIQSGVQ